MQSFSTENQEVLNRLIVEPFNPIAISDALSSIPDSPTLRMKAETGELTRQVNGDKSYPFGDIPIGKLSASQIEALLDVGTLPNGELTNAVLERLDDECRYGNTQALAYLVSPEALDAKWSLKLLGMLAHDKCKRAEALVMALSHRDGTIGNSAKEIIIRIMRLA